MIMMQEIVLIKVKEEFEQIAETIRQATIQGTRIDVIEENLWDQMLGLGRLLLTRYRRTSTLDSSSVILNFTMDGQQLYMPRQIPKLVNVRCRRWMNFDH
jgi:hypothetical protein